ncbi:hypothetical protein NE237_004569 [Protea cynaroides]|uniref:Uncharacterized protein n=1 Tax=Protea cynaroides TaxID=273540 RepID=A0A9Q0QTG7_9MAGN|nr:hypothetical protein NE237_004569 [Protea cynaroides]
MVIRDHLSSWFHLRPAWPPPIKAIEQRLRKGEQFMTFFWTERKKQVSKVSSFSMLSVVVLDLDLASVLSCWKGSVVYGKKSTASSTALEQSLEKKERKRNEMEKMEDYRTPLRRWCNGLTEMRCQ